MQSCGNVQIMVCNILSAKMSFSLPDGMKGLVVSAAFQCAEPVTGPTVEETASVTGLSE
jgi:hypothetical protein